MTRKPKAKTKSGNDPARLPSRSMTDTCRILTPSPSILPGVRFLTMRPGQVQVPANLA